MPPTNFAPVALSVPNEDVQPLIEKPEVEALPDPIAVAASHPRPRRRPVPRTNAAPAANVPPQVATAEGLPDESAIGELTAGGDANPQRRQEAADVIDSNEKRLKALSARIVSTQRSQVSKIRNFQRQAKLALDSGDAEGALTLATKAKLLLYDLDRGGGN
ncbi:MAG: hypothetical protein JWM43_3391 [Acidobacteriaceae bacterium]|nr:hypothetical protein [Acidobacteriaceae bacterium]